jgi:cell division protein FtsI/penicillin-binding protein 2
MANEPTFNPNAYRDFSETHQRNRAVQDLYEPGSTFKIVTASAAINENVLSPSTLIDTNPGFIRIGNRKPIPEDKGHNYGVLSFEDVIVKSSNVGAIKTGFQVGPERMMRYVRGFGFGQLLAPDFSGESKGLVTGDMPGDSSLASISMGYEIGVTPIQVATAASVVANGGLLVQPHLLRAVIANGRRDVQAPNVLRRVIAPATAMTVTSIMEGVVERGTAKTAQLERYLVAGKTGTAKKAIVGGYSQTDYCVSFVGFVPSRDPVYTILVVVDRPTKMPKYGGVVAGPIFQRIAEAALQYAGVVPSIDPAPPIVVPAPRSVAPVPPRPAAPPVMTNISGVPVMPDLQGLTLRDALRLTNALGLRMTYDGDGVVVSQSPAAGTPVAPADRGAVQLRRAPTPAPGGGIR